MKSVLGLVVAMMLVAPGCGDDTTSAAGNADLSVTTPADLSVTATGKDMTVVKATTCAGALTCVEGGCLTDANPVACAKACASALAGTAASDFNSLFTCVVQAATVVDGDGGTSLNPILAAKSIMAGGACVVQAGECTNPAGLDH